MIPKYTHNTAGEYQQQTDMTKEDLECRPPLCQTFIVLGLRPHVINIVKQM